MKSAIIDTTATVAKNNRMLGERLDGPFRIPDDHALTEELERAQELYEAAKMNEVAAVIKHNLVDAVGYHEFEQAVTRLVDAAPKKPDGTSALARTPAEKLAEIEPGYVSHKTRLLDAANDRRWAEMWHSIAYQRLETVRSVYNLVTST
jgi:hypothetical protein